MHFTAKIFAFFKFGFLHLVFCDSKFEIQRTKNGYSHHTFIFKQIVQNENNLILDTTSVSGCKYIFKDFIGL